MQQFQRSPVGSFIRSPVGSRNRAGPVEPTARILVLGFNRTNNGGPATDYLADLAAIDAYLAAQLPGTLMKLGVMHTWQVVPPEFLEMTGVPPTGTTAPIPRLQVPRTVPLDSDAQEFFDFARHGMVPTNVRFWNVDGFMGSSRTVIEAAALALNPDCGFFTQVSQSVPWVRNFKNTVFA